jgi:Niemann-Pick C1 protein
VTETLSDIGAAVLCGATSTALAVAVLLGSSSYVFEVLSTQFALTVALGVSHGLILLPVLLSLFGPKPFAAAENIDGDQPAVTKSAKAPAVDQEISEKPSMKRVDTPQAEPDEMSKNYSEHYEIEV